MVARFLKTTLALLTLLAFWPAAAQNYATSDTVTEYPNKGTFYHDRFEGRKTASGEIFDQNKFTAAHWKIKLGTMVMVTNRNTGLQVIVKVNDRCPKKGVFDLSHRAATAIGIRGSQPVTVRVLPDGYEERWAAQETMFDSVYSTLVGQSPAPADTVQKPQPAPQTANAAPAKHTTTTHQEHHEYYKIDLGIAASHGDAFNEIQKLPEIYRDKVTVEQLEDSPQVKLTLEVKLPHNKANELRRAILHTFPDATVVPSE